jgi:cardiolipin synthase (CMP-forming)
MGNGGIVRSIWLVALLLLAAQIAIYIVLSLLLGIPVRDSVWVLPVAAVLHIVMGMSLSAVRNLFCLADSGVALTRVNVPNVLSLIRISSTPIILWLILIANDYPVVPYLASLTAMVFLTDLLDGQISRRTNQVTNIGKYLDSSSDYAILFVTTIAWRAHALIHPWVFVLVLVRLGFQVLGQVIIFAVQRGSIAARSSFAGKASVFGIMALYAISLLHLVESIPGWFSTAFLVLEIAVCAVVVISLGEKAYLFVIDVTQAGRNRSAESD